MKNVKKLSDKDFFKLRNKKKQQNPHTQEALTQVSQYLCTVPDAVLQVCLLSCPSIPDIPKSRKGIVKSRY